MLFGRVAFVRLAFFFGIATVRFVTKLLGSWNTRLAYETSETIILFIMNRCNEGYLFDFRMMYFPTRP
jgi:hypothetical protein